MDDKEMRYYRGLKRLSVNTEDIGRKVSRLREARKWAARWGFQQVESYLNRKIAGLKRLPSFKECETTPKELLKYTEPARVEALALFFYVEELEETSDLPAAAAKYYQFLTDNDNWDPEKDPKKWNPIS